MDLNFEVKLNVGGKEFSGNIRDVVKIDESNITTEFVNQPSTYAWFAALAEIAGAESESRKFDLSVLRANLDKKKREDFTKANVKVTENVVASAIETDVDFIKATKELLECNRQYSILRAVVRSLDQRAVMLTQIGNMKRQEFAQTDWTIKPKACLN